MAGTGAWGEAEVGMGVEEGHMFQDTDSNRQRRAGLNKDHLNILPH